MKKCICRWLCVIPMLAFGVAQAATVRCRPYYDSITAYYITQIEGEGRVELSEPMEVVYYSSASYNGQNRQVTKFDGIGLREDACSIDPRITELVLPASHMVIGYKAFSGTTNLQKVVFRAQYSFANSIVTFTTSSSSYIALKDSNQAFMGTYGLKEVWLDYDDGEGSLPGYYVSQLIESKITRYADAIYYRSSLSNTVGKVLRNMGYGGRRICYDGDWKSYSILATNDIPVGYVEPPVTITNYVYTTITNEVYHHDSVTNVVEHFSAVTNVVEHHHYSTVTNVIHTSGIITNVVEYVPAPGTSPAAAYRVGAGSSGTIQVAGAAGWDAYGVPDGMTWDSATGALNGAANKSGTYDLLLVSGSGTDTQIMRTTIEVKGYSPIVGYVGVTFVGSGAPFNCLANYKTLPAGLKWDAKTQQLTGIPTKAQTLALETIHGDPITIDIQSAVASMAGTYNGVVGYVTGEGDAAENHALGNLTVTVAASGKLTAKVVMLQSTYSFSANAWDSFADGVYCATLRTKAGDELALVLDATKDWKSPRITAESSFKRADDDVRYHAFAWRNEHGKTDAIAGDPIASEFVARIKAQKKMYLKASAIDANHFALEPQAASAGADLTLTFNANGTVTCSGKLGATKVTGSSTLAVDGDTYRVNFDFVVPVSKTQSLHFRMDFTLGPSSTPLPDFKATVQEAL